jgi:restriction endonuclease S subunit
MTVYRFDQIAENVNERVMPDDTDLDRYVGLEHLDPESLQIRRWGSPADVIGQKLRFWKGDIVFGRRRAYQRKLAVADFDGICSAHAMVLRAKPDVILPEFLPFFLQSDLFMDRAIEISVGSLSPTINWRTLAEQEFPLPPIDEQRRIADLLWAADDVISSYQDLLEKIYSLKRSVTHNYTRNSSGTSKLKVTDFGELPETWSAEPLGNLLEKVQYGLSKPLHEKGEYPVFRMMNIIDGKMAANDMKYIDLPGDEFETYKVNDGDILFNRTNSADLVGKLGIFDLKENFVFASYLIRLVANRDLILPEYLNSYLNSDEGQRRISAFATAGVSQTNINASNLQRVLVPVPPLDEQTQIVSQLNQIDSSKKEIIERIEKSQDLKKQMLTRILG